MELTVGINKKQTILIKQHVDKSSHGEIKAAELI